MSRATMGIIVGGGPAPGINGVIGSAAIEAINSGWKVIGFYDGFKHLSGDDFDPDRHSRELTIREMGRVHFKGGSILRTARTSLLDATTVSESSFAKPDEKKTALVLEHLRSLGVTHLLTIGGDDTALSARFVAQRSDGSIRVVHVPKTIDNDLPLPGDVPTFGFTTARHLGSQILRNLMDDAETTERWYIVATMGRNAGFLALGIGKGAGATLTLIPEEFGESTTIREIADVIEGAIIKRRCMGRRHGVVVIAEGIACKLGNAEELKRLLGKNVSLDGAGHPRLSEVPLERLLKDELSSRFAQRGDKITVVGARLGYELRCAPPATSDMIYTRDLGHGGVRLLREENSDLPAGVMVTLQNGELVPMPFEDLVDPKTNRTRIRKVDINSYSYSVARAYMIRLEQADFDSTPRLAALAAEAKMSPEEFKERFAPVIRGPHAAPAKQPASAVYVPNGLASAAVPM